MVYNPIFEEEKEKRLEFRQLKKEIKKRAHKETIKQTIDRIYHLLQKKPVLTVAALFHPLINLFKAGICRSMSRNEETIIGKT